MQKWEYTAIVVPDAKSQIAELNSLGELGWELVQFLDGVADGAKSKAYVFKRPKV